MTSTSADKKNKLVPELNETKLTLFCRTLGFFLLTFHMSKFLKALTHFDRNLRVYNKLVIDVSSTANILSPNKQVKSRQKPCRAQVDGTTGAGVERSELAPHLP